MINLKPAKDITFFAKTNFRNEYKRVGIKTKHRRKHTPILLVKPVWERLIYYLLETMAISNIQSDNGALYQDTLLFLLLVYKQLLPHWQGLYL